MIAAIESALGRLFYSLFYIVYVIIDLLQKIFLKFAGAGGTMYYNGVPITSNPTSEGGLTETGIIYYLFQSAVVKNLLFSIMILALFLIVIFTAMAIIKNIYASKPKSWKDIVANSFKGLANFVFVPVCCLLGVWAGNILLNAIAGATSVGGSTQMTRQLFNVCSYDANRYRCDGEEGPELAREVYAKLLGKGVGDPEILKIVPAGKTTEEYAVLVDDAYGGGYDNKTLDIYSGSVVEVGYKLFKINYLMLIVGGVFMMYVLINLAYAMVQRMFVLLMLFVISPAMAAMYPLDDGKAIGGWKGDFLKNTIMAYSAVAGMNLFFSLSPIINNIELGESGFINGIVRILLLVIGLFCVNKFIGMIGGYIGSENAIETGKSMRSSTKGALKKYGTGGAKKVIGGAFRMGGNVKRAWNASKEHSKAEGYGKGKTRGRAFGAAVFKGLVGGTAFDAVNALNKETSKTLGYEGKDMKTWGDFVKTSAFGQAASVEKEKTAEIKSLNKTREEGEFGEKKLAKKLEGKALDGSTVLQLAGDDIGKVFVKQLQANKNTDLGKLGFAEDASYGDVKAGMDAVKYVEDVQKRINAILKDKDMSASDKKSAINALATDASKTVASMDAGGSENIQKLLDRALGAFGAASKASDSSKASLPAEVKINFDGLDASLQNVGTEMAKFVEKDNIKQVTAKVKENTKK